MHGIPLVKPVPPRADTPSTSRFADLPGLFRGRIWHWPRKGEAGQRGASASRLDGRRGPAGPYPRLAEATGRLSRPRRNRAPGRGNQQLPAHTAPASARHCNLMRLRLSKTLPGQDRCHYCWSWRDNMNAPADARLWALAALFQPAFSPILRRLGRAAFAPAPGQSAHVIAPSCCARRCRVKSRLSRIKYPRIYQTPLSDGWSDA